MADRFIALGVGQGDAFCLERNHAAQPFRVLVDGGRSRHGLPALIANAKILRRQTQPDLDVMVCTHNDADHAEGLIGFFDHGLHAREVWLPGSLTRNLQQLLEDEWEFARRLGSEVGGLSEEMLERIDEVARTGEMDLLEAYGNVILEAEEPTRDSSDQPDTDQTVDALAQVDRGCLDDQWLYGSPWPFPLFLFPPRGQPVTLLHVHLFQASIKAMNRIKKLAIAAHDAGATLRWFEHSATDQPAGGDPGVLEPLNAKEIFRAPPALSPLRYLALTTVNKESLVFHSPGKNGEPAVIFSADSGFDFRPDTPLPWTADMIVTAPHHGAEANRNIADRYRKEANGCAVAWVRSDMRSKSRPADWYRTGVATQGTRYCTYCRNSGRPKHDVALVTNGGQWANNTGAATCCCK